MTIETKYNIGDEVWVLLGNRPFEVKITDIYYFAKERKATYYCSNIEFAFDTALYEEMLFPTKEELLKSL